MLVLLATCSGLSREFVHSGLCLLHQIMTHQRILESKFLSRVFFIFLSYYMIHNKAFFVQMVSYSANLDALQNLTEIWNHGLDIFFTKEY